MVEVITPVPTALWDAVVGDAPATITSQTSTWRDCVVEASGFRDLSRLYVFDDGVRVLLPLGGTRFTPRALTIAASWPFDWGIGGPVATPGVTAAHCSTVYDDLLALGYARIRVRVDPHADLRWWQPPARYATHRSTTWDVPLDSDFDRVAAKFSRNIRKGARKAVALGVRVQSDAAGRLLPAYFELFDRSIARWSRLQHEPLALTRFRNYRANPPAKIREIDARFGPDHVVWVAFVGGRPAAAALVLNNGPFARIWRSAMDEEVAAPTRANHLLQQCIIEQACAEGRTSYQMGDAKPGTGLARFKTDLGGQPRDSLTVEYERVPLSAADAKARAVVKRLIGFQDVG